MTKFNAPTAKVAPSTKALLLTLLGELYDEVVENDTLGYGYTTTDLTRIYHEIKNLPTE